MIIDATFWVAVSFFIFVGGLIYLKVPQKVNNSITIQIDKSKKEAQDIINTAKKESEKNILDKTKKFHELLEERKKNAEQKIIQMKENAIRDIKAISVQISIKSVVRMIQNSVDKSKLEKIYTKSLDQAKASLKSSKI